MKKQTNKNIKNRIEKLLRLTATTTVLTGFLVSCATGVMDEQGDLSGVLQDSDTNLEKGVDNGPQVQIPDSPQVQALETVAYGVDANSIWKLETLSDGSLGNTKLVDLPIIVEDSQEVGIAKVGEHLIVSVSKSLDDETDLLTFSIEDNRVIAQSSFDGVLTGLTTEDGQLLALNAAQITTAHIQIKKFDIESDGSVSFVGNEDIRPPVAVQQTNGSVGSGWGSSSSGQPAPPAETAPTTPTPSAHIAVGAVVADGQDLLVAGNSEVFRVNRARGTIEEVASTTGFISGLAAQADGTFLVSQLDGDVVQLNIDSNDNHNVSNITLAPSWVPYGGICNK